MICLSPSRTAASRTGSYTSQALRFTGPPYPIPLVPVQRKFYPRFLRVERRYSLAPQNLYLYTRRILIHRGPLKRALRFSSDGGYHAHSPTRTPGHPGKRPSAGAPQSLLHGEADREAARGLLPELVARVSMRELSLLKL